MTLRRLAFLLVVALVSLYLGIQAHDAMGLGGRVIKPTGVGVEP